MKYTLLLFGFLLATSVVAQEVQEKYQHAKISYTNNPDGLAQLEALGISVEHGTHKKGHFVISDFSESQVAIARSAGFTVEILVDDAKEYFLEQNRNPMPVRNPSCDQASDDYETPSNFHLGSMGGYLTYQELLNELDEMKAQYPNLITAKAPISNFMTEGQPDNSVTPSIGGNAIQWVKISDNPDMTTEGEPQILYSAIHHAREPASLSQLVFYMWYLLENYDSNPEVKDIVDNTELYFVPVVNPDGYLYNEKTDPNGGGFWRKNRKNGHGVDNNRNYDYYIGGNPANGVWGGEGTSGNTSSDIYRGTAPFSEIENQAMKWFVENHNFVMAFNNHTSGDLLLYPYGYAENVFTPENSLFEAVGDELVSRNGFTNQISSDLYAAAGTSDDFMYGTIGTHDKIYSFTPEIGPSFWPVSSQIIPISKGMMYLNLTSAKMVNNFATVNATGNLFVGDEANQTAKFDIRRLGIAGSGTFTVSLNPISTNFAFVGGGSTFTSMDVLETQSGSINYTVASGTQAGDDIVYELVINNGSYDSKTLVTKKFGALTPIFEDAGDSVSDNFTNNGWGVTGSTFVSPSSSITESPNGDYQNNANETITLTNEIDLTEATGANLSFYAKWEIEDNWDYTQVEVSINNGASWEPQCGKYTNAGSTNNSQPTGEPLYDGVQSDWVLEEIDLSDYLGESILVRFQFSSDGAERGDGFYFDDLAVNVVEDTVLSVNDFLDNQFVLYPNPVQNILNIETPIANYGVEIFNIQGQKIFSSEKNANNSQIDYSSFAAGMYVMRLTSESSVQTFRIVKQ
ncbi:T9SS type A sorting domain-containing protein [Rasiella rasia]|uniref:T9SS type A sorting domain-containing protein n=1 Tax=Rasiella rasia TaxID=2744027 RepID=A0A6G6GQB9_9FLAO|nr:M14 family zinc carboxypeptidase [Rasiella rasia]QIE60742.1 T9SS type A sorting domain-containing protein [Rasiella rasia]